MTRSPDFVVVTNILVRLYCSATSGEMLALKPPVPSPVTTSEMAKAATAPFFSMTPGTEEMTIMMWPRRAMAIETQMVLNRPQCVSATYAPKSGMT
jgi:hypothetical protein